MSNKGRRNHQDVAPLQALAPSTDPRSVSNMMGYMFAVTRPDLKPVNSRTKADLMLLEWYWRHTFRIPRVFPFAESFVQGGA